MIAFSSVYTCDLFEMADCSPSVSAEAGPHTSIPSIPESPGLNMSQTLGYSLIVQFIVACFAGNNFKKSIVMRQAISGKAFCDSSVEAIPIPRQIKIIVANGLISS
eukprot:GHVT01020211.1.p1 GENE.GHVT01020211.1~~GHVT01020211.1.p1  ORF type:complete len:106 (-),score=1.76 GHVT01020211.1:1094-1411(-)